VGDRPIHESVLLLLLIEAVGLTDGFPLPVTEAFAHAFCHVAVVSLVLLGIFLWLIQYYTRMYSRLLDEQQTMGPGKEGAADGGVELSSSSLPYSPPATGAGRLV
jgi:hypothetical protein